MAAYFCYESPLFWNILSCEVKKQNEYVTGVVVYVCVGGGDGVQYCSIER